ncbi:hypothetical protein GFS60_06901 (plasmid) [Rhodococcus sp. WAY2]|nr:hypothetical protein GFS60_06901 [Rhodococcus sp. WAY2]
MVIAGEDPKRFAGSWARSEVTVTNREGERRDSPENAENPVLSDYPSPRLRVSALPNDPGRRP